MDRENSPDIFPLDGAVHSFDVVIRGYDRSQVHDVVDRLDGELRVALADKDASTARAAELASHLSNVQAEVESLRQKAESAAAPNFESMGARISHMLKLAEEEANDIRRIAAEGHTRSQAELQSSAQEAARLRSEAQDEARKQMQDAQAQAGRQMQEAKDSAAKTISDAQAEADALKERARAAAEQAEQRSRARVAKIEEDFQLSQKARRAEAARVEQERDQSSRRDAHNRIEQAQRKSDDMIAAAEERVRNLDAQRGELHTRLTQVRELLGSLPAIDKATDIEPSPAPAKPAAAGPTTAAPTSSGPTPSVPNARSTSETDAGTKTPAPSPAPAARDGAAAAPGVQTGTDQTQAAVDEPTDAQKTPPPPPTSSATPSWPVNTPTQPSPGRNAPTRAIPLPRQG
ncbi:MAG: hypothetical protein ACR2I7_05100 [Geodermatophilaceae bacterium]